MSDSKPDPKDVEIALLRAELDRMRSQPALTMMGTVAHAPRPGGGMTTAGVEEMILQVGADDTVGYVNSPMAKLLGMPDKKMPLGTALDAWDHGTIGAGTLSSLVQASRASDAPQSMERACPDLDPALLPGELDERPACDPILNLRATPQMGRVHVVAQDVTKLRWLEATFSRYVSPKVIDQLQNVHADEFLAMESREVTILFCDLRGFTSLCQEEPPDRVQETVNSFLTHMVEQVDALDGTVQGFVGDEVMAIFGAPMPMEDHALRGLICAASMRLAHMGWIEERNAKGLATREAGIGLASGQVVVGNIGTPTRMDYTAQGHPVNLAARLCGAAGGGEILTVKETHGAALAAVKSYDGEVPVPRFSFGDRGVMTFKNVAQPIRVISVATKASP